MTIKRSCLTLRFWCLFQADLPSAISLSEVVRNLGLPNFAHWTSIKRGAQAPSPSESSASTTGGRLWRSRVILHGWFGAMLSDTSWAATTSSTRTAIEAPRRGGSRIRAITGPAIAASSLAANTISSVAGCVPDGYLLIDAISRVRARQSHRRQLGIQGRSTLSGSGQLADTSPPPPGKGLDLPPARNVPGTASRSSVPASPGAASHGRVSGPWKMIPRQNRWRARSPSPVEASRECSQSSTETWVAGVSRR